MDRHLSSPLHSVDVSERKLNGRPDTNESRTFWAMRDPCDAILAATRSKCLMFHLDVVCGWKLPRRPKMWSQPGESACSIIMQIRTRNNSGRYISIRTIREQAFRESVNRETREKGRWEEGGRAGCSCEQSMNKLIEFYRTWCAVTN